MSECRIFLDNYQQCYYYPGNQIQGRVIVTLTEPKKCRDITVKLIGHEHTEWTTTESKRDKDGKSVTVHVQRYGDFDFLCNELLLHRRGSDHEKLPSGQHIYPFSFTIPLNIPATYKCEYGYITYFLKAVVDRPWAIDYTDKMVFEVRDFVDLSLFKGPELLMPTTFSESKTLYACCCICSQGDIEMEVYFPKKTITPGETVNITTRLSNLSKKNINGLEISLNQTVTLKVSSGDSRRIKNKLVTLMDTGLAPHSQKTYITPITLPSNTFIPNFTICRYFKVEHYYTITAKIPGPHINLKMKVDAELGHIDVRSAQFSGMQVMPMPDYGPSTSTNFNPSAPLKPPQPPSYDSIYSEEKN